MTDASGVLVVAETVEGKPTLLTNELLGLARRLGPDLGGEVATVLLGSGIDGADKSLIAHGADRVYVADDALLSDYQADAWLPVVNKLARDIFPAVILIGHTSTGADLAPRLAFRLGTTVAMACTAAAVADGKLMLTRPCYGGNAREVVSFRTSPAVATIKAKSQEALARDDGRAGEVIRIDLGLAPGAIRTRICDRKQATGQGSLLETANVVVSGGRGLNGPEGFKMAEELARLLGGAVGASRVACDLGWCPPSYQIGLSGRTVAPELYIALGISGAGQHMAGCASAKNIIAINTDADAEIFKFSRFGVVEDCRKVLPPLIEEIRRLKD
jgi:electron transfer flavoprotein alpha subunit